MLGGVRYAWNGFANLVGKPAGRNMEDRGDDERIPPSSGFSSHATSVAVSLGYLSLIAHVGRGWSSPIDDYARSVRSPNRGRKRVGTGHGRDCTM